MNLYAYTANDPVNGVDPTGMAEIETTYTVTGSRTKRTASVTVDADYDNDGLDDLDAGQLDKLGKDYSGFIRRNDGANISNVDRPEVIQGDYATNTQAAFIDVATQFVSAASMPLSDIWGGVQEIRVEAYDGSSRAPGRFDKRNKAGTTGIIRISLSFARNFSNGSALAHVIYHEALHPEYGRIGNTWAGHEWLDSAARTFIKRNGLNGGGCPTLPNFTWGGC